MPKRLTTFAMGASGRRSVKEIRPMLHTLCRTIAAVAGAAVLVSAAAAQDPPSHARIVFLGDSITQAGGYVEMIEAALIVQAPDVRRSIIRLGLASETVSGLSEAGHAGGEFPRPSLHERLDRVLAKAKPDLVVACYGMNDGIYHPLSDERMQAFKDGILELRRKVAAAGAALIHVTPPVFDPQPIREKVLPSGLDAYPQPYQGYDAVLAAYAAWLLDQRPHGWTVVDLHGPMLQALESGRRRDPTFTLAADGVHPGSAGHVLMARALLGDWGISIRDDGTPNHPDGPAILEAVRRKHAVLAPAWLSHVGHRRPGITPGLPLEQAETQAAVHDTEARRLARGK